MTSIYSLVSFCLLLGIFIAGINGTYRIHTQCPYAKSQEEYKLNTPVASGFSPGYASQSSSSSTSTLDSWLNYVLSGQNGKSNYIMRTQSGQPTSSRKPELQCSLPPPSCENSTYYRTLDGSCNNLEYPAYGMARSRYGRVLAPNYGDGIHTPVESVTGAPLPNARLLSMSIFGELTLPDNYRTLALMQWGQFVSHDLSEQDRSKSPKDCCEYKHNPMCMPVMLSAMDPIAQGSGKQCLSVSRTTSDANINCPPSGLHYAEKISKQTAYLDLSIIYGNSRQENQKLRLFKFGLLKTTQIRHRQFPPISSYVSGDCGGSDNNQCFTMADNRNQFTPTVAVLHTIFVREHNRIANALAKLNPHLTDEQLFQQARKINIGQYQKITYYDWLPLIIGRNYAYNNNIIHYVKPHEYVHGYDASVNSAVYAETSVAALRYLHNTIPGWFSMVSPDRRTNETYRLSNHFARGEDSALLVERDNFDALIRGLVTQLQKRSDGNIDREIKHYFNRKAFEQVGGDLKTIDIQRGRDFGLGSYNAYRAYCGLSRAYDWSGFANEISPQKIMILQKLYKSPEDVELSVGGSLEAHSPESLLGPTFQCLVGKQFLKTRISDRFFFEHENIYSGFTREQLVEIRKVSLSSLLCNNGDYLQQIQANAFIFPNTRNMLESCQLFSQIDLTKWISV